MNLRGSRQPALPDALKTEGCSLHSLAVQHWALDQALSRDPDVVAWTYYPVDMTEQQARQRIQNFLEEPRRDRVRRYVISTGEDDPVGTCAIGALDEGSPRISYAVLPEARKRGFATRAARLLAECALTSGYGTVSLETIEGNLASERVASKAEFVAVERYQGDHRGQKVWMTRWTRTLP